MNKFANNFRVISLTLSIIGLVILFIEGYINNAFDTTRLILIGIFIWNIFYFYLNKPQTPPAPPTNI